MANVNPHIAALPKERWVSLNEIFAQLTDGKRDAGLWRLLIMTANQSISHDGYRFESNQTHTAYRWTKQASAPESEASR